MFNGTDNFSYFNFTTNLLAETKRAILTFKVKQKSDAAKRNYDEDVFNSNVDSCKAGKGIFGNYIIKFFLTHIERYSNLKVECPQKKGFYYAYNFPVPMDAKAFVPSFMPFPSSFWQLTIDIKTKVSKSIAAVRIIRVLLEGQSVGS